MPDLVDILMPRTDHGVLAEAFAALAFFGALAVRVRHDRDALTFVLGLATVTVAWFAVRAVH